MPENRGYPSGIGPGLGPNNYGPRLIQLAAIERDETAGNDPSWLNGPYLEMSERWQPMLVCMGGTQTFREHAGYLLPIEPEGGRSSLASACRHAVMSPFTMRIADQAVGLIMRKPIQFEPKEEDGEVDEYWTEWIKDC